MAEGGIIVRDNAGAMRFEAEVEGKLAVAEYRLQKGAILFSHTEVPAGLEGRGIAKALARAALEAARARGLKVIPACSFIAGYMQRHPETHDLVDPDYRTALER